MGHAAGVLADQVVGPRLWNHPIRMTTVQQAGSRMSTTVTPQR
jgi:hypothetical protein